MKALTICQPYAELICRGEKRVENRDWHTDYRGPLLIHAGKSRKWLGSYSPLPEPLAFGAIVGFCHVVACIQLCFLDRHPEYAWLRDHDHTEGPLCWIVDRVARLERPIPWRGMLGLFDVPDYELEMAGAFWLPAGPPAQQCRVCGCTEHSPCEGGCWWVEEDLCSACAEGSP